jgi:hypothetical protein
MKPTLLALLAACSVSAAAVDIDPGLGLFSRFSVDPMGNSFELMGAEATLRAQVSTDTRDVLTAFVQVYASGVMAGMGDWVRGFHFGEAYAVFPLGLTWPAFRVGQAVVPFGLLASYDQHTEIVQTPYARFIGLRLDPGLGLQGALGDLDYALWVSNGSGPDRLDNDRNKLITARVAPTFLLGDAEANIGLSALAGSLPYWPMDSISAIPEGPRSYNLKYRLGLDNTTDWGPLRLRLEGVAGRDGSLSGNNVFGYFAEARWAVTDWLEPIVVFDGFHAEGKSLRTLGAGLNFYPPGISAFQVQSLWQTSFPLGGEHDWKAAVQLAITL